MKGFPQMIWSPCAIFRVGPRAQRYQDPWQYAVVVIFPWPQILRRLVGLPARVEVQALSADGKFSMAYARPIQRWVRKLGYREDWDRFKQQQDGADALELAQGAEVPQGRRGLPRHGQDL